MKIILSEVSRKASLAKFLNKAQNGYIMEKNTVHEAEPLEKTSKNATIITMVVAIALALLLTFIVLFYTGLINRDSFSFFQSDEVADDNGVSDADYIAQITGLSGYAAAKEGLATFTNIQLPMLISSTYDAEGKERGCDSIQLVDVQITETTAPLNGAYRALFSFGADIDQYIGNYVMNHPNLKFEKVTLNNGVANVYLLGELSTISGVCDEPRLRIQLEEVAFQFATITGVEIFINGELY